MIKEIALNILRGLNRKVNRPDWKNLRTTRPVSDVFGYDRGNQSVARYYIDQFVDNHRKKITGQVLEVGNPMYIDRYKETIDRFSILHYKEATDSHSFVGDLTRKATLPDAAFDCFICTQTFNFIYDFKAAIEGSWHVLKPGGYLIATVSGIQQISKFDQDRWGDYWRFTEEACARSFSEVFGQGNVETSSFGNVLSCVAALEGLASTELTAAELNDHDRGYQLIVGILARRKVL